MRRLSIALLFLLTAACDDADHDGFSAPEDCDDHNADVNPDAVEVCDGVDNNCDGQVDPGAGQSEGTTAFYADQDGDGFGDEAYVVKACEQPSGFVATFGDCDDSDAAVKDSGC